ncbi:glutathione S-transferase N-terminal domain-containing protein [Caballeronia sp. RCC_10]|uniref:glutathione S-transferase N-terminal domain-containing protein n=1 Tax=Caballeronia sp. RCC_10 TaxID=3239227 RepID=UPI00352597C8
MMKLIGSHTSPFVRKVRIVMAEKKIDCELVLEDVWASNSTIHDFNPLGKVPCLILDDGEAVFDSRVICEFVDTLTPVGKLLPQERRERTEVRCWEALADGMLDAAVLIRLEGVLREEAHRSEAWIARQRHKIDDGLRAMAQGLGSKQWCSANRFTLADIACGCTLAYLDFRMPDLNWREAHPALDKFYARLAQRQSFVDTAPA